MRYILAILLALSIIHGPKARAARATETLQPNVTTHVTNSLGMKLVQIEPGSFTMGFANGEWDERPVHRVAITHPFLMATTEVTNGQYDQFSPEHRRLRGRHGLSKEDDEAVVFVSWHDAVAFCAWLTEKEGKPYRLPTEAEWEYACRAGMTTSFSTGEALPEVHHENQTAKAWGAMAVSLRVGVTPANRWGLHDMHGNVEEWCGDWYGTYAAGKQRDPVGRTAGYIKVTRGGSHSTPYKYLRSANRAGTLPEDRSWLIGFRVVQAELPETRPLPLPEPASWAADVTERRYAWSQGPPVDEPYFAGPILFQKVPPGSDGPMYSKHNHCPAITWCDNGDLLAVWFSCLSEAGREMTIVASRLRAGIDTWTEPSEFFNAPDRNMTGSALLNDGRGQLYFFNGLGASQGWQVNLALAMRTSTDHGAHWSTPQLINPARNDPTKINQPIASAFRLRDGTFVLPTDAPRCREGGGTALWFNRGGGESWHISEGTIAGIHASTVELRDGRLMAFGRSLKRTGHDDRLPMSISDNGGATWEYSDGPFPAIGGGQRLVLRRLREGPLLLVSFTESHRLKEKARGQTFRDNRGESFTGYGMFAALSFDEGQTWPIRKLLTAGGRPRTLDGGAWTGEFVMDPTHAEPGGYLAATQTPDGVIHLISSRLHYRFNLFWLKTPNQLPAEG